MNIADIKNNKAEKLFYSICRNPRTVPVSLCLNGETIRASQCPIKEKTLSENNGIKTLAVRFALSETMEMLFTVRLCEKYGETEFFVTLTNNGTVPSEVISRFMSAQMILDGDAENAVLKGIGGDYDAFYAPYEMPLKDFTPFFRSERGRPTHTYFPYFNLDCGTGGWLIALGWGGTWSARFEKTPDGVAFTAANCPGLETVLLPGESIRSALTVLIPYNKTSDSDVMNLWRRWFIEYNMPRKNREGDPIRPFTTSCFACDTGLPNSDGSISENSNTWRETVDKLLSENIALDYRWFDAGWYSDPDGNTVSTDWFGTVGSWTIDRAKWGEDGFEKSVRYCRSHGIKTLAWFEPERVSHTDALEKNFGYDRRWAIDCGKGALWNNIGDPDCLKWTTNRIVTFLRENDVDMYREDFNIDPKPYWDAADCADAETYGLPRAGITENKGVCAHYALWDAIIADMAERGKDTFVDCCASGGGRNDILSLRRGIPLLRSDADRTTLNLRLSMTTSFNAWIPFCGSSTKETARQEEVSAGADDYAFRASFLPVMNLTECWSKNKSLDYDAVRRSIDEWKSINDLLLKDVYFLTPWQNRLDDAGITALAYFDDQNGKGVVLAFRKENCERDSVTVKLPFAGNDEKYVMRGENLPETAISGKTAAEGLVVRLPDKRTSALVYLERIRP